MAEDKKSFVLYSDYIELFEELSNEDAGQLIKHILSYVNDKNPETNNQVVKVSFVPIKLQLKRDLKRYEAKREQWSEAGKRSAEAKRLKKEQENERSTESTNVENVATESTVTVNATVNATVTDNVTVNDSVILYSEEKPKKRFIPPDVIMVKEYCLERQNKVDSETFINHYTSNGWMVGKNKMKDWKAAVRTWEKNNLTNNQNGTNRNQQTEEGLRAFIEGR